MDEHELRLSEQRSESPGLTAEKKHSSVSPGKKGNSSIESSHGGFERPGAGEPKLEIRGAQYVDPRIAEENMCKK